MRIDIEMPQAAPDRQEMDAILREYYELVIERLVSDGGPQLTPEGPIEDFWEHMGEFLPPRGRVALARTSDGKLVGCGTLACLGNGRGEIKRLFVRPEARGTGLGRRLIHTMIAEAKSMGMRKLLFDTLRLNVEMRGLCTQLGFREISAHSDSGTVRGFPELAPFMLYFQLDL